MAARGHCRQRATIGRRRTRPLILSEVTAGHGLDLLGGIPDAARASPAAHTSRATTTVSFRRVRFRTMPFSTMDFPCFLTRPSESLGVRCDSWVGRPYALAACRESFLDQTRHSESFLDQTYELEGLNPRPCAKRMYVFRLSPSGRAPMVHGAIGGSTHALKVMAPPSACRLVKI